MVVLKMPEKKADTSVLRQDVEYREKLWEITNRIHAASDIDEILINLRDDVTELFEAERFFREAPVADRRDKKRC